MMALQTCYAYVEFDLEGARLAFVSIFS